MPKRLSSKARGKLLKKFLERFRITDGKGFKLSQMDPGDTAGVKSKQDAQDLLQTGVRLLAKMQDKLYAQDQWGVLLVFQAMDAAGKDGAIKHVMSGINPQGCQVFSFKSPSAEELDHDFLWRTSRCLPERGRIGIFNRSYYEEVLAVRVHPEFLAKQKLPQRVVTKRIWEERFEDIRAFERYMARQGYLILKFFLNVSKKEQKNRFLARLDLPEKNTTSEKRSVGSRTCRARVLGLSASAMVAGKIHSSRLGVRPARSRGGCEMSHSRKRRRKATPPAPAIARRGFPRSATVLLGLAAVASAGFWWSWGRHADAPAAVVSPPVTTTSPPAAAAAMTPLQRLAGRWERLDGGYVLEIRGVAAGGKVDAAYFNPQPIHVAKAEASQDGAAVRLSVELRDVNYPGSTYDLRYDPGRDVLEGTYFQAVERQTYDVSFGRR
jgi:PPK2 family polyphosphate:nucleotide phosphotransferase